MKQERVITETQMRTAFANAHPWPTTDKLRRIVAGKLRGNHGRIFSKGWKVIRRAS